MHKGFIWGAVAALGLSAPAFAEEGFSYSYLDLGYVTTSVDDSDIETDGFGLFGSLELTDQLHLLAGFSTEDLDLGIDANSYRLGAGLNFPLSNRLDIETHLLYVRSELDTGFGTFKDDGAQIGLGLRGRVSDQLELTGSADYVSFDGDDGDESLTFGARYFVTPKFALGGDLTLFDDGHTFFLGGRLNF